MTAGFLVATAFLLPPSVEAESGSMERGNFTLHNVVRCNQVKDAGCQRRRESV